MSQLEYHHHHRPGDKHIEHFPNQSISKLAPFSGLILSLIIIIYSLIRIYMLEGGLCLLQRLYGNAYSRLSETNRRGFLNHHIAGTTKLLILILAAYPFILVEFHTSSFRDPYTKGSKVKMGDILIVAAQMLMGMYAFELIYRVKVSPVSVVHHVCTIAVGQAAIAINLPFATEKDGTIEFLLCCVWGAFDIIAEIFPHLTIILYRVYPTHHSFLAKIFLVAACTTLSGTVTETIVVMYFFGSLWDRWDLAFKILTPILHVAFAAAQLHGTRILFKMWLKEKRLLDDEKTEMLDHGATVVGASGAGVLAGNGLPSGIALDKRATTEEGRLEEGNLS